MAREPIPDPRDLLGVDPRYQPPVADTERVPLGGYVAPRNLATRVVGAGEVYYPGDEYRLMNRMTPAQVARIQTQLAAAGLIGPTTRYIPGNPETTRSQFRDLLAAANGMGMHWRTALTRLAAMGVEGGGFGGEADDADDGAGAAERQRPIYEAPNRADVRAGIRRGLFSQFGTAAHGVDIDELTDLYLARHQEKFSQQLALWESGGGGTVEAPQSLEGFVEDQAMAADPAGVAARKFLDRANDFINMLSGPVGGG